MITLNMNPASSFQAPNAATVTTLSQSKQPARLHYFTAMVRGSGAALFRKFVKWLRTSETKH
jgi:hypothetical protein